MNYPFWTPGFFPTSVPTTPSNSQLEQMVVESKPAASAGIIVYGDAAPDVVMYPDLKNARWHKTILGEKSGTSYYYNGIAWTPELVVPGTLRGDSFANQSIGIEKIEPGTPLYVAQTEQNGLFVQWAAPLSLYPPGSFPLNKLTYGTTDDNFLISVANAPWIPVTKQVAADKIATGWSLAPITAFNDPAVDGLCAYEVATKAAKAITHLRYMEMLIDSYTPKTVTTDADKLALYDAEATAGAKMKSVSLADVLPNKGTPGVYASPLSITTDEKGRVTAISSGGGEKRVAILSDTVVQNANAQLVIGQQLTRVRFAVVEIPQAWLSFADDQFTLQPGAYMITYNGVAYRDQDVVLIEGYIGLFNSTTNSMMKQINFRTTDGAHAQLVFTYFVNHGFVNSFEIKIYAKQTLKLGWPNQLANIPEFYQQLIIHKLS